MRRPLLPIGALAIALTGCDAMVEAGPRATATALAHASKAPAARGSAKAARADAPPKISGERVASTKSPGATPLAAQSDKDADDAQAPAEKWGVGEDDPTPDAIADGGVDVEREILEPGLPASRSLTSELARGVTRFFARATGPRLASIAKETWVHAEPRRRARRIGYLRAGSLVHRSEEPVAFDGCKGGWYGIEPQGYVCAERTATIDLDAPLLRAARTVPRMNGLPYDYAIARLPGPVFYARVPTAAEQSKEEPDLGFHMREVKGFARDPAFVAPAHVEALPAFFQLAEGAAREVPGLGDAPPRGSDLTVGQAKPRAGFALLGTYDVGGRAFGLTTDMALIPLDRTRMVSESTFHGVELGSGVSLPVAFIMKHQTTRFVADASGQMRASDALSFREVVPITGKEKSGGEWVEATDGSWLRNEDIRRVDAMHRMPAWASPGHKWIDVSILRQALVAYEDAEPKYVTLVSTGADGLGDPATTHSTIQGVFLIHTKHVTVTMDNDDANDAFDLRDVPFVQYFHEGYALHAAYWHDDFGTPRSHGCVNLAPIDAAWIFGFTTPDVPDGWHAALSLHKGTLVYTHP